MANKVKIIAVANSGRENESLVYQIYDDSEVLEEGQSYTQLGQGTVAIPEGTTKTNIRKLISDAAKELFTKHDKSKTLDLQSLVDEELDPTV